MGTVEAAPNQLVWQQDLTGQVFDPASLNMFWFELTAGAYGPVEQVGAIVEVVDGSAWHLSFQQGGEAVETELPVERWLNGRPDRPSQIEVVGAAIEIDQIEAALADCGLSDEMLAHYQAQFRERL
jgi:hypothetical protein